MRICISSLVFEVATTIPVVVPMIRYYRVADPLRMQIHFLVTVKWSYPDRMVRLLSWFFEWTSVWCWAFWRISIGVLAHTLFRIPICHPWHMSYVILYSFFDIADRRIVCIDIHEVGLVFNIDHDIIYPALHHTHFSISCGFPFHSFMSCTYRLGSDIFQSRGFFVCISSLCSGTKLLRWLTHAIWI